MNLKPENRPQERTTNLLLNPSQAEATYAAMCALNNVSFLTLSARLPSNDSPGDVEVRVGFTGLVRVFNTLSEQAHVETYPNQAAFAEAYGLP